MIGMYDLYDVFFTFKSKQFRILESDIVLCDLDNTWMELAPFWWYDIERALFVVSYIDVLPYIPNENDMLNLIKSNTKRSSRLLN